MPPGMSYSAINARISRRGFMRGTAAAVAAVGTSTLASCSSGNAGNGPNGLSSKGKPVKGGPKTTPNTDVIYPDGYVGPIASHKGPVTTERAQLTVVVPENVQVGDWSENDFTKWYEKRTNVHVNFKTVAGASPTERMTKVNAMISSGDLPDVFMGMGFTPSQVLLYGRDQGLFAPLNDIIEGYCPETRRIFHDYPDAKSSFASEDRKIYQLPNINDCFQCAAGDDRLWIYQPWLDELGLNMPETLDEFEEVLRAFKTRDPNRNGEHDEIPLTTSKDAQGSVTLFDKFIMGSFLYNPGSPWLVLDNGKVDVVFNKPGWRQGLQYMNKLYGQGLIPKQAFTQTNEQLLRQGNAKTVVLGCVRQYYQAGWLNIDETASHPRYLEYVCVPVLKGPAGVRTAAWDYYFGYGLGAFIVTTASKIPEIAAMWGDGLYELEAVERQYQGPFGQTWRWAKKGEMGINRRQAVYQTTATWPPSPGKAWVQEGIMYRSRDFRQGRVGDPHHPTIAWSLYENTKRAYYPHRQPKEQDLPSKLLAMSQQDAGTVADLQATLNNYVSQMQIKFTTGQADPNSSHAWSSYLSTLQDMKLRQYLKIYQHAYDARPS